MTTIIAFLKSIPDVVWSGVIASLLTLSGVLISNRSNTDRLKLQLQHYAAENAKERAAALRREVYLRMAEEMVKANAHLATLPRVDLSKTNLGDGLQGFFAVAARLQLVAEPKTSLLVNQLAAEYGELVMKLVVQLMPVNDAKTNIQIADDSYSKANAEVNRILSEMTKLNESGRPDPSTFEALDRSLRFQRDQTAKYAEKRNDAWKSFQQRSATFHRYLLSQLRDISSKQIPVMIEIRRDLGLTSDLAEIEENMKQQWSRMETQFDAVIAALGNGK